MSFLAPFMWLAALLAVPVVLFYLVRDEPRRRVVSTLLFWVNHPLRPQESPRWQKLRRPLSLLLQLLFLFLIVAALARPVAPWEERAGRATVFVLDTSLSMAARDIAPSRFESALDAIRSQIEGMRGGDRAALLMTGSVPRVVVAWTRSRRELLDGLAKAEISTVAVDPSETLALAKNLVQGGGGTVRFFTDTVWDRSLPEVLRSTPANERQGQKPRPTKGLRGLLHGVEVVSIGAPARNAGIILFAARRSAIAPGEILLSVRVAAGSSAGSQGDLRFQLLQEGQLLDARDISLQPGEVWEETWAFPSEEACRFEARLTGLEGDVLAEDDVARVDVPELSLIQAVLVSPPDLFWESALAAIPRVEVERMWPPDPDWKGDPDKLWIFRGIVPREEFQAAGLVLSAPETGGFFGTLLGDMPEPLITQVDESASVTRYAFLERVRTGRATEFRPADGAIAYASSVGRPLIFGNWEAPRRWVVMALDPAESNFVLQSAFPVLLTNLVQGLRGDHSQNLPAAGPHAAVTSLRPNPLDAEGPGIGSRATGWLARPLWWWLLAAATLWVFVEWFLYHRRWTE